MAQNGDTNVVARGGLAGLAYVQGRALRMRIGAWPTMPERIEQLHQFDRELVARNLSPGGSADLLAVSWFLANLEALSDGCRGQA
jgi:triphosphoribosyl-dephospho-CoA synthase